MAPPRSSNAAAVPDAQTKSTQQDCRPSSSIGDMLLPLAALALGLVALGIVLT
ncbi:hypothetical protein ACVWYH_002639 [Bradyrhizobium sp. GM24.11]|jgi:hypothetical protein